MELLLFYIIGGLTVLFSFLVIVFRNPLNSALSLIVTFFLMAGLYLLLDAEFIAIIQLVVYAGAIMVLFLFVIMLLNLRKGEGGPEISRPVQKIFGMAIVAIIMPLIGLGISTSLITQEGINLWGAKGNVGSGTAAAVSNTKAVAGLLFTDYLLPFEITSVLLLAAMIGVVYLAKRTQAEDA